MHDLEDGGFVLIGKGSLKKGEPLVAESVVHVYQRLLIFGAILMGNFDFAGEVEGHLSAWILFMLKVD